MTVCAHCDQPILPDEPREIIDIPRPTGPDTTITIHKWQCQAPPRQTYPARNR